VLIDVAGYKGVAMLPEQYRVTKHDIKEAARKQKLKLQQGDIVLILTGRMKRIA
jgi:hypothetical protein